MTLKDFARYAGNRAPELTAGVLLAGSARDFHDNEYIGAAIYTACSLIVLAGGYIRSLGQRRAVRNGDVYRKTAVNKPV